MTIANTNDKARKIMMPSVGDAQEAERELYQAFVGHIRHVPTSRTEIKILSSIQFTADALNLSDAHVSKMLVEMGLRAPRLAFPLEFLDYADACLMRYGWDVGAPSEALIALRDYWFKLGESAQPSSFRHVHAIIREDVMRI